MGIFARGNRLWARYKNEKGQWVNERTGYAVGQEDKAKRYLARINSLARDVARGRDAFDAGGNDGAHGDHGQGLRRTLARGPQGAVTCVLVRRRESAAQARRASHRKPRPHRRAAFRRQGRRPLSSQGEQARAADHSPRVRNHGDHVRRRRRRRADRDDALRAPQGRLAEEGRQGSRLARHRHLRPFGDPAAPLRSARSARIAASSTRSRRWLAFATARPRACAGRTSTRLSSHSPASTSARPRREFRAASPSIRRSARAADGVEGRRVGAHLRPAADGPTISSCPRAT